MIYPKKRKAMFGLDLGQLNMKQGMQSGGIGGIGDAIGDGIKKLGTQDLGYGVSHTAGAAKIGGDTIATAAKGLEIGKKFGPYGAAIGAIGGAAVGLGKGIVGAIKDPRDLAEMTRDSREMTAISENNYKGVNAYNTLQQKQVMEYGGEIPDGEDQPTKEEAVILGGKRHKEGGNDILDENGQKVAETEREEIVFTADQTEMIDRSVKIIEQGNENEFLNLGSYIKEILLNRTEDHSGKFKELNNADLQKD